MRTIDKGDGVFLYDPSVAMLAVKKITFCAISADRIIPTTFPVIRHDGVLSITVVFAPLAVEEPRAVALLTVGLIIDVSGIVPVLTPSTSSTTDSSVVHAIVAECARFGICVCVQLCAYSAVKTMILDDRREILFPLHGADQWVVIQVNAYGVTIVPIGVTVPRDLCIGQHLQSTSKDAVRQFPPLLRTILVDQVRCGGVLEPHDHSAGGVQRIRVNRDDSRARRKINELAMLAIAPTGEKARAVVAIRF